MQKVILIGDSIRMGYQDAVHRELEGEVEFWQPEENGGTTENVLVNLDEWLIVRQPEVLHINCGLHDLAVDSGKSEQRVPLPKYRENVARILKNLQKTTSAKVIWTLTTPVNERWHHERKGFDRWEADVLAYNDAAREVAARLGVPVNDLYKVVMDAGRDEILTEDGVHFKPEGSEILGKAVATAIREEVV